ncbi:MAG: hypothetical protein QME96_14750 [Myxococcota bacterium]|nr:hypothetical protein [Myxococcota bacterium]
MKVLPLRTAPPAVATKRRHAPEPGSYETYKPCLRWEFGFTCAFCLLHERDLDELGSGTLGLFWVEHRIPQDDDPDLADAYSNCYWSCGKCNGPRKKTPVTGPEGERLLDPCRDAWAEHFRMDGDHLVPLDADADAAYTWEAYRIDAPLKVAVRAKRRKALGRALDLLDLGARQRKDALRTAETTAPDERPHAIERAESFRSAMLMAREIVLRYAPIPPSAPSACRCSGAAPMTLPDWLERQLCEVPGVAPEPPSR